MIVSPFTPLFFINRKADGIDSEYIQTFATTDQILLQLIGGRNDTVVAQIISEPDGAVLHQIQFNQWDINDTVTLRFTTISLSTGYYSVNIMGVGRSEVFRVTDDPLILNKTTLIQYSMRNNRQRQDAVFFIDGMQYFFDFRVPGGFKDSNWTFNVESEQFVTQYADISQLFGLESTQKRFTLGGSMGVPVWFGEMLNRILICSHVYFDGIKYSRKEANVPELTVQLEGVNSFVFNQTLQQSTNLDPVIEQRNHAAMRRVDDTNYRATSSTINRLIL
ncbi:MULTISPECIES: hypothetical protein [Duncaniella]|jgi:hypothetical protein|uniref:hypothetical protein n=1 Tax=Duncaniella TaxID=2518495 RepID=UPI0010A2AECC|nr:MULTISPECIES: hypothetical protein [Duncaniella]QCD39718.1 hypothetical protein E7745_09350 [Duncaniella sp. C9]